MRCPKCNKDSKVIDSRMISNVNKLRRRRECLNKRCKFRFTTREIILDDIEGFDILSAIIKNSKVIIKSANQISDFSNELRSNI